MTAPTFFFNENIFSNFQRTGHKEFHQLFRISITVRERHIENLFYKYNSRNQSDIYKPRAHMQNFSRNPEAR